MANFNVSLKKLTEKVSLDVVYTPKGLEEINVEIAEVNRPGLFLAGYYDYFDKLRLQILGLAEMNFLSGLSAEKRYERLDQLFSQQPPAVIVCRSEELEPFPVPGMQNSCHSHFCSHGLCRVSAPHHGAECRSDSPVVCNIPRFSAQR
jgi:serine kinase of HPr protein (carbohydrate metabolism regulator)